MTLETVETKPPLIDFKLLVLVLLFSLPIPVIGWLTSWGIQSRIESNYETAIVDSVQREKGIDIRQHPELMSELALVNRCSDFNETSSYVKRLCSNKSDIATLETVSILTLILSALLIVGILVCGVVGRINRLVLLGAFRIGLWLTQLSVAGLVLGNAALAILTIYWAESWFVGRIHFGLIGVLGFATGITAIRIAIGSFRFAKKAEARVFGKRLGRVDHTQIWSFVETLAKEAGTKPPDHIVVGLEPMFFVTEASVVCLDGTLKGRTLFLSLPFCRILNRKELAAIVGHEMAHFVGFDTSYSRWFFPIYRGATETVHMIAANMGGGLQSVAFLPPLYMMSFFLSSFARIENDISRGRELAADKLGAMIAGVENMATSLIKVHAYAQVWDYTQGQMKKALEEGKVFNNVSEFFAQIATAVPDEFYKSDLGKCHTQHPTDTHPLLSARLKNLGFDLNSATDQSLKKIEDANRSILLIEKFETVEQDLSEIEHYKLVKSGLVSVKPDTADESNP